MGGTIDAALWPVHLILSISLCIAATTIPSAIHTKRPMIALLVVLGAGTPAGHVQASSSQLRP